MITIIAEVDKIIIAKPEILWDQHHSSLGLSKQLYDDYFEKRELAHGILLSKVTPIQPAPLDFILGKAQRPPQSYWYLSLVAFGSIIFKNKNEHVT